VFSEGNGLGSKRLNQLAPDTGNPTGDPVPLLNVALVPAPDQVVVRLTGDADLSTVPLLTDALGQAAALGTRVLVVDVAAARFWDSSALRALASVSAGLIRAGRSCRIVGAGPATRRLIRAADLADHLELDGPLREQTPAEPAPARPPRRPTGGHSPLRRTVRAPVAAASPHRWN